MKLIQSDGQQGTLIGLDELPSRLVKSTGDWRLVIKGGHKLHKAVHLSLQPKQRLIIEGDGDDAALDLRGVSPNEAALCLEAGQFEVRELTMRYGPAWSVQVSRGVRYSLARLRILDARGGGIVVWGPCGVDEQSFAGNRIEYCLVEHFNIMGAKWTHDAISVRDNQALITHNVIRNSSTETAGIRLMGAGNHVEENFVLNVGAGDAGGIYLWGGEAIYTAVGNLIRHNVVVGTQRGVYLDDGTCAARVEQNYLIDCHEAAVFIGGGRDNIVRENIALRCPIFAHVDNRRAGWPEQPGKSSLFSAARARLKAALRNETIRADIAAGGLDVHAFEILPEAEFNQPAGNRIVDNVIMPAEQESRWENYAQPGETLVGGATDSAHPNRRLPALSADWKQLTAKDFKITGMPSAAEILGSASNGNNP